jgi:hypothetical protein
VTPENLLFQKAVEHYPVNGPWKDTYAHGLFDAFLLITGEDPEIAMEHLYEAVMEDRQRSHDEMIDAESEF